MVWWIGDIKEETKHNNSFRTILFTGEHTQLAVMKLTPGEEIGLDADPLHDQFIHIVSGRARIELGPDEETGEEFWEAEPDWAIMLPAGLSHNVVNIGDNDLLLYALYSPPAHPNCEVQATKDGADAELLANTRG